MDQRRIPGVTVTGSPASDERFRELYAKHFEAIRAYCLRRVPVSDANDAVAEVFVVVWRKIDEVPEEEWLRPWLYGIARNVVAHARRSASRRIRLQSKAARVVQPDEPGPEMQTIVRSENREVLTALANLPEQDREALQLRVWEELTAAQIAGVLGVSVAAAEKRVSRAYRKLGRAVGRNGLAPTGPHSQREGGER